MIIQKLSQINSKINFYKKDFKKYKIEKFTKIIENNFLKKLNNKKKTHYLFIDPISYFKSKVKEKYLLPLNVDKLDGKIENMHLISELKKNFSKKKIFKKFLEAKGKRKIDIINVILIRLFNLKISKYYFYKDYYLLYFQSIKKFLSILDKDFNFLGKSSYNCFWHKNKKFKFDFKFVVSKLHNSNSKKTYKNSIFGFPQNLFNEFVKKLKRNNQYFDYINLNNKSVVINCGVDKGYEIPEYLSYNIKHLYNIDPSGEKYLHSYVKSWNNYFRNKITTIKKALYDDSSCYVYKNNQITNLSSIIKQYKINKIDLIKADIEGGEKKLIEELPPIIKKFRPQLSIAIYHVDNEMNNRFAHLTFLPKELFKICKNYLFFIEHYAWDRREIIIYCIPKEKYQ